MSAQHGSRPQPCEPKQPQRTCHRSVTQASLLGAPKDQLCLFIIYFFPASKHFTHAVYIMRVAAPNARSCAPGSHIRKYLTAATRNEHTSTSPVSLFPMVLSDGQATHKFMSSDGAFRQL